MTIEEMRERFRSLKVPESHYEVTNGLPNERYCIGRHDDGSWHTYYSERGNRNSLQVFDNENDACVYFLGWVASELQL